MLLILRKHLTSTPRLNNHLSFGLLFILLSQDGGYGKPNNDSVLAGTWSYFLTQQRDMADTLQLRSVRACDYLELKGLAGPLQSLGFL